MSTQTKPKASDLMNGSYKRVKDKLNKNLGNLEDALNKLKQEQLDSFSFVQKITKKKVRRNA